MARVVTRTTPAFVHDASITIDVRGARAHVVAGRRSLAQQANSGRCGCRAADFRLYVASVNSLTRCLKLADTFRRPKKPTSGCSSTRTYSADHAGKPGIDKDWNELLFDVSNPDKRARLALIVGGWVEGCASAGFDAVEVDNLDSYARSGGGLTGECDVYTSGYGEHVLMIEYRKQDFDKGCKAYPNYSIVLRDLNLAGPGDGAYIFDGC